MKVVILGTWSENELKGGPAVYISHLVKSLGKLQRLDVYMVSFGSSSTILQEGNAKIVLIKDKRIYHYIPIFALIKLRSEIRNIKPDLIHLLGSWPSSYRFYTIFCSRGVKKMCSVFGLQQMEQLFYEGLKTHMFNWVGKLFRPYNLTALLWKYTLTAMRERVVLQKIPNIVVESHYCKHIIAKMTKSRIFVVPDGIDYEIIQQTTSNSQEGPDLFFVGLLHPIKGADLLCNAVPKLVRSFRDLRVYIAGYALREEFMIFAGEMALNESIKFLGPISEEHKFQYMKASKIVVVPSRWDFSPIVPYEAAACGRPIVASTNTNSEILVHGETGLLFETDNVDDLTEKIGTLLVNPELREKLGRKAQEKAMQCDWSNVAAAMVDIYQEVIEH